MSNLSHYWIREYSKHRPLFIRGYEWSVLAAVMHGERNEITGFVGHGSTEDSASDHAKSKVRVWAENEGTDVYFPQYA
jgi:hypothetical protein